MAQKKAKSAELKLVQSVEKIGSGASDQKKRKKISTKFYEKELRRLQIELVKLQMSYKLTSLDDQVHLAKAQQVIKALSARQKEIKRELNRERQLNEKNSQRLKNIRETLNAVENALSWVKKEQAS